MEQKRQELTALESNSMRFLGHDEFFSDEMERVVKRKRYISAEELHTFVRELLTKHYPACTIEPLLDRHYELTVSDALEQFVAHHIASEDPTLLDFRRRCGRSTVRFTFDSDVALNNRDIDFLTVHHPLIRAIVKHYEEHPEELHPVARVFVRSAATNKADRTLPIPVGDYFYFIYRLEVEGARKDRTLQTIAISTITTLPLSEDVAEDLLTAMITNGETLEDIPNYGLDTTARCQREGGFSVWGVCQTPQD